MRSKLTIKCHPIHPILVVFPITFFITAFVLEILFFLQNKPSLSVIATWSALAGVITALIAAIPGFIDYLFVVPPDSSAKKRGTKHGLLNVTVVMLFLFAQLLKKDEGSNIIVLIMEGAGIILLNIAGFMGGTLVVRNQIGIDHRYASAGKWKEIKITSSEGKAEIKLDTALQTDQMMLIHVDGRRMVIGKTEEGYVAFDDHCTHRGGSLADGVLICSTVQCPWHGSQFDVKTGLVKAGPAKANIHTYKITEEDKDLVLHLK